MATRTILCPRDKSLQVRICRCAILAALLFLLIAFSTAPTASAGDGTWTHLVSLDESYNGRSVAVDPTNPSVLLVGQNGYGGHSGIYRSDDQGISWTEVACGLSVIIGNLQFVPRDSRIVYAWVFPNPPDTPGGLDRSPDRSGRNYLDEACSAFFAAHGRGSSLGNGDVSTVNGELREPTAGGLHQSLDGGKTWKHLQLPAKVVNYWRGVGLYLDPKDSRVVYATVSHDCKDKDCKESTYRSADQGKTWKQVPGDDRVKPDLVNPDSPESQILINPLNQAEVFAVRDNAVVRSTDSGRTFSPLGSSFGGSAVGSLALDRANPQTLYAATNDGLWAYTLTAKAGGLPRTGDPLAEVLPILAVLATSLTLVGLRLRAAGHGDGQPS